MGLSGKHIAVICNYQLLEDRVGGMDYFFWAFNKQCADEQIIVDWFFPNISRHGDYSSFHIIAANNLSLEQSFLNYIKAEKASYTFIITHFVELCTSFYADIKKNQQAKIIAVDHNPRPLKGYSLKKRLKKRLKGILYSRYIEVFIGVSNYTSHAILKDFGSHLKPKTQTIYNGVLLENIMPKTTDRNKVNPKFLVVSHLRESKGIQDLINAVYLLAQPIKDKLKIDVFGDGPYKNILFQLVKDCNLESVFNFKGSQSNLKVLYQQYDYLIQPTHMECFSLSILESLAANIPVITTSVGGNTEVVTPNENGFIFQTKDIKALSSVLTEIIQGQKYIAGNTRTLIKDRFSIDIMVKNHLKLIGV